MLNKWIGISVLRCIMSPYLPHFLANNAKQAKLRKQKIRKKKFIIFMSHLFYNEAWYANEAFKEAMPAPNPRVRKWYLNKSQNRK